MGRKAAQPSHCTCKQHVLAPLTLRPSSPKLQKYLWATCSTQTVFSGGTSTTETREMLGGQSSVVRVSLMPGKDQVSVSFRSKCGFCAHLCHKALRKKQRGINKIVAQRFPEPVKEAAAECAVICSPSWWSPADLQHKPQLAKTRDRTSGPNQGCSALQVLEYASALTCFLCALHPGPLGRRCYCCSRTSFLRLRGSGVH